VPDNFRGLGAIDKDGKPQSAREPGKLPGRLTKKKAFLIFLLFLHGTSLDTEQQ